MEKENQEVIGYQVGERLVCPECYGKSLKILSFHEIESPPAKSIKKGDIENFICEHCKELKELLEELDVDKRRKMMEKEKDSSALQDRVTKDLGKIMESQKISGDKIDMVGKIIRINRKVKFIKKILHAACEGRRLSRRNILTLRIFFDDLGENLDMMRLILTCSFFDDMEYRDLLNEQTRRNFLVLTPKEQEVVRMWFGDLKERGNEQRGTMS